MQAALSHHWSRISKEDLFKLAYNIVNDLESILYTFVFLGY